LPDHRRHRGPHPEDAELFSNASLPSLRHAVAEISWLLSHNYAPPSALKLVGDRHALAARQRTAIMRAACPDGALRSRCSRRVHPDDVRARPLLIDGFNLLTTLEAALAGGILLLCRDGSLRDLASVHGTWRQVEETTPALQLAAQALADLSPSHILWYLDTPVSNSARLRNLLLATAAPTPHAWRVELVPDPDPLLSAATDLVVSADSVILDRCGPWLNLARHVVETHLPAARLVDLTDAANRP
jgi:hypothetical protein